MHFTTLALLASSAFTASAAVLPKKTYSPYVVEQFAGSQIPTNTSYSTVSFFLSNKDPNVNLHRTQCNTTDTIANTGAKGTNGYLGPYPLANCTDTSTQFLVSKFKGHWTLYVETLNPVTNQTYAGLHTFEKNATGYYRDASGQKLEKFTVKPNFKIPTQTQVT